MTATKKKQTDSRLTDRLTDKEEGSRQIQQAPEENRMLQISFKPDSPDPQDLLGVQDLIGVQNLQDLLGLEIKQTL